MKNSVGFGWLLTSVTDEHGLNSDRPALVRLHRFTLLWSKWDRVQSLDLIDFAEVWLTIRFTVVPFVVFESLQVIAFAHLVVLHDLPRKNNATLWTLLTKAVHIEFVGYNILGIESCSQAITFVHLEIFTLACALLHDLIAKRSTSIRKVDAQRINILFILLFSHRDSANDIILGMFINTVRDKISYILNNSLTNIAFVLKLFPKLLSVRQMFHTN